MKLVLIRHGQSEWNKENRFAGWTDVGLSDLGREEARRAGEALKRADFHFDIAYTSVLTRAKDTLNIVLKEMGSEGIKTEYSWKLNERHYGALQGLNKAETAVKYGDEQVRLWRRSVDVRPPLLDLTDERHPKNDPRYSNLLPEELPRGENLIDTYKRVVEYWRSNISKEIENGKNVIIAAHGNSLRALIKYLENISDEDIMDLEIPTGLPIIYEIDKDLVIKDKYQL